MRNKSWHLLLSLIFALVFYSTASAQDSPAKLHEEMARSQAEAAKLQETNARLAGQTATLNEEVVAQIQAAAKRAQEAADRAQAAANKAREAADIANSPEAQASAIKAQDYANEAQDHANKAQQNLIAVLRSQSDSRSGHAVVNDQLPEADGVPRAVSTSATKSAAPAAPLAQPTARNTTTTTAPDFNEFLNRRFDNVVRSRLGPKNNSNQNETPSISSNSTSLVERSSVGDLVSLALNPFGRANTGSETSPTSSSTTLSAYALKAFASGRDPLDPSFYTSNRNWRKVSFTYGVDYTKDKQTGAQIKSKIYGFKLLPYDKRDVSDPGNQEKLRTISDLFHLTGPAAARITSKIKRDLFDAMSRNNKLPPEIAQHANEEDRFDAFIASLSSDTIVADLANALGGEDVLIRLVDGVIEKDIDPEVRFRKAEQEAFDAIRRKPQIAFTFLTTQREENRADEYASGVTTDLGVLQRWNFTFNGLFNYVDNKQKGDSRGGTFATELQIPLNAVDQLSDRVPWTFSFAASGKWLTGQGPRYQGQLKLLIPIPQLPGLELPLSISFANRKEFLIGKESKIRGHVGFTFDLAKLLAAFKNQVALPLLK